MKIGIDLKPFSSGSKYRGIGMYARELIYEMIQIDEENEFHYLNLYNPYDNDPKMNKLCKVHEYYTGPKIIDVGERQLFRNDKFDELNEATIKHFIQTSKIDAMLFTSPNEYGSFYRSEWFEDVFKVGILYDLIPLVFPEQCLFDKKFTEDYNRSVEFIKNMDLLLAISESAKKDAIKLLGIPEDKIVVIYAGINKKFKKLSKFNIKELKSEFGICDPFFMFAGGIDFKKNIEGIIKAFSILHKDIIDRYQLIITGKAADDVIEHYKEIAKKYGVEHRIIFTGYISLDNLVKLYNSTSMLIFPSLYEGFGLPVLEAMACGAPVVTSNCSSLKEIAEGYATLVNPKSAKSISKGIEYVLNNPIETLELAEKSIEYAQSYTWNKVASIAMQAINIRCNTFREESKNYQFSVTKKLLRDIAVEYSSHNLVLNDSEKEKIAEYLLTISNKTQTKVIEGGCRIIYDFTVVIDWLRANYNTGIGRVCKELYKALKEKCLICPVVVELCGKHAVCKKIDMEQFEILEQEVILSENDIFFMPGLQIRGVQIPNNHPKVNEIRAQGIKCYAILYDILPIQFPMYFEKKTGDQFYSYVEELIENYDGIITDSKAVSDELIELCNTKFRGKVSHNIKIGYFHLGTDSFRLPQDNINNPELVDFMKGSATKFLMVGTIEPRKGQDIIVNLFEELWEENHDVKLCIIGHVGWNMDKFVERLKDISTNNDKLLFLEAAKDTDLQYAYQNSSALIQASAGEGFGLPLIEASHFSLPILCSDIPVFHEIAGDNAMYFNRNITESIKTCILEFIRMKQENKIIDSSKIKVCEWKESAEKIYKMIAHGESWYGTLETDNTFRID